MQSKKNRDDLEYLAARGFEGVSVTERVIRGLERRVQRRFFPRSGLMVVGVVSLLIGVVVGAAVFYYFKVSGNTPMMVNEETASPVSSEKTATLYLDTVVVTHENFVSPSPIVFRKVKRSNENASTAEGVNSLDTLQVLALEPVMIPTIVDPTFTERKLKFIVNSPLVYIYDLKVSDYRSLYFKKNQFVRFGRGNTPADQSPGNQTKDNLKQETNYFLHEELAAAMRLFRSGDYSACSVKLLEVDSYSEPDINCDFYLGMCYYYKHYYAKAIERLDACIGNSNNAFLQEASYYKALALVEQGNKSEGMALLKKIVEEGEFYSEMARKVVDSF